MPPRRVPRRPRPGAGPRAARRGLVPGRRRRVDPRLRRARRGPRLLRARPGRRARGRRLRRRPGRDGRGRDRVRRRAAAGRRRRLEPLPRPGRQRLRDHRAGSERDGDRPTGAGRRRPLPRGRADGRRAGRLGPAGRRRGSGGIFVVELPAPRPTRADRADPVGKWLERVPDLRLDGEHPTSQALAARLAAFWLPSARVLYVGATDGSIGGRVEAIRNTVLGDRRPHSGGALAARPHRARAGPDLVGADRRGRGVRGRARSRRSPRRSRPPSGRRSPTRRSSCRSPTSGPRPASGRRPASRNSLARRRSRSSRSPAGRVVEVPPGAAEGAGGLPPSRAAGGTVRRAPRPARRRVGTPGRARRRAPRRGPRRRGRPPETTWVSADGPRAAAAPSTTELDRHRRPEVIARIKAAKELGDLKENADYTAAREEQSFLEGRIAAIEATLRDGHGDRGAGVRRRSGRRSARR